MLTLGVDPDTVRSGVAIVDRKRVWLVAAPSTGTPWDTARSLRTIATTFDLRANDAQSISRHIVEGQEIYASGQANANHLISLAHIAGAAASVFPNTTIVLPKQWKGQRPKGVSQKATLEHYGWKYKDNGKDKSPTVLEVPKDVTVIGELTKANWNEVLDATGIALWGAMK